MRLDPQSLPLAEFAGRLCWSLGQETIHGEPPWLSIRLIPGFPGCNPAIADAGIVWDVLELFESARRPGAYQVLNCDCGYPPDAEIEAPVFVSHPDADTVIWEIDALALAHTLTPEWAGRHGFVRLVFSREAYEHDICAMLDAIRGAGSPELPVGELAPDVGGMALDRALALDCELFGTHEPIEPPGTLLEFGFFGSNLLLINGKPDSGWPVRLFPCWSVYAAFRNWLGFVSRGFAVAISLDDETAGMDFSASMADAVKNHFFLLRESERAACDLAGNDLASLMKAALNEGNAAPGVAVAYYSCICPAVSD